MSSHPLYLFDAFVNTFYSILQKDAVHTVISGQQEILPFKKLQKALQLIYQQCQLASATYPSLWPSEGQVNNMTVKQRWGRGDDDVYALTFSYAPENANNTAVNCMSHGITEWVENYSRAKSTEDQTLAVTVGLLLIVSMFLVLAGPCLKRKMFSGVNGASRFFACNSCVGRESDQSVGLHSLIRHDNCSV